MEFRTVSAILGLTLTWLHGAAGESGECAACRTSASASVLSLPPVVCSRGERTEEHAVVRTRTSDGRAVLAGGDIVGVALSRGVDELYPLAVIDRCDGTYAIVLPCHALEPGEYVVSARLEHAHARDVHAPRLWFCGSRARGFTAWDALDYATLGTLYACARGAPLGASGQLRVRVGAGAGGDGDERDRIVEVGAEQAAPPDATDDGGRCWADSSCRSLLTARDGRAALPAPLLAPCALPGAAERAMRFVRTERAAFHHCFALSRAGAVRCAQLAYDARVPDCLRGQRLALVGDSVTEGTFADVAHMWAGEQRDARGLPIDKRQRAVCKWRSRLRRMVPAREPPTALHIKLPPGGSGAAVGSGGRVGGGSHLNVTLLNLKIPYRSGLANFLRNARALRRLIGAHDIVILESARHDFAPPFDRRLAQLGAYRQRVTQLAAECAAEVRRLAAERAPSGGRGPLVFWRTAASPPGFGGMCNHKSNNPAVVAIANAAASDAFAAAGLCVLPQHEWAVGFHNPRWWPTDRGNFSDVHAHEGWCDPMYAHPGIVHGWISKALTQLAVRAVCAAQENMHSLTPS